MVAEHGPTRTNVDFDAIKVYTLQIGRFRELYRPGTSPVHRASTEEYDANGI
jgi:hypothetical protein